MVETRTTDGYSLFSSPYKLKEEEVEEMDLCWRGGKAHATSHGVNVIKSFIGSNYLSIPFAFAAAGLVVGPIAVCCVAIISGFGCLVLVAVRKHLLEHGRPSETYGDVARSAFGFWGYILVECFLVFTQFGYCVGYTIYITAAVKGFAGPALSTATVVFFILAPPFIALCSVPDLKRFIPFSMLSNLALLVGFIAIVGASVEEVRRSGFNVHWGVSLTKLPLAFGNLVASFEGIGTILPVEGAMARDGVRAAYPRLLIMTLVLISVLFSTFGVVGYGAYGPQLCSVILTNLGSRPLADLARGTLIVGLFFTYGFQIFPVLEIMDRKLLRSAEATESSPLLPQSHEQCSAIDNRSPPPAANGDMHQKSRANAMHSSSKPGTAAYTRLHSEPSSPSSRKEVSAWPLRVCSLTASTSRQTQLRWLQYMCTRVGVVLLSSSIAYFVPQFELVIALVGSLGASMLAFIVPGLLGLKVLVSHSERPKFDTARYAFLVVFGVVGGGIGTWYALMELVKGSAQC